MPIDMAIGQVVFDKVTNWHRTMQDRADVQLMDTGVERPVFQ